MTVITQSVSAAAHRPLSGIAVATMFRGAPAQLVRWCNVHLNRGADAVYVVLDRPSPELQSVLAGDDRVTTLVVDEHQWAALYPPGGAHVERRQVEAARRLMWRAAADGHRHCAFVDADEVLDLSVPFAELAGRSESATAYTVPVREMWFEAGGRIDDPFGATLAVRPMPGGDRWIRALDWRAQYFRNGVLGHDAGKTIYALPLASGDFSVHGPLSGPLRSGVVALADADARVLHFDSGSVRTWNAKWSARRDGSTDAIGLGAHRRAQQRLFDVELRRTPEQQRAFFADFFALPDVVVGELVAAGVATRVDLAAEAEAGLSVPADADAAMVRLPDPYAPTDLQFAMVCDDNFVAPTFATLLSVLAKLDPARTVRIVLLGDGLQPAGVRRLRALADVRPGVEVLVHDVTPDLDRDLGNVGHKRSRATYARVYLVDHLPEQRTVYLDGDVLATRDISELFDLDLGDACLAGVTDSAAQRLVLGADDVPMEQRMKFMGMTGDDPLDYLNAGVLVLDVPHPDFRTRALRARAHVSLEGRVLAQHDQDAINLAFRGHKHRLPATYNYMTQFYTSERSATTELIATKYAAADASLIHFSGKIKPWIAREDEFYNGLYRKIVTEAEEQYSVSCGFHFSRPAATGGPQWRRDDWRRALADVSESVAPMRRQARPDIEVVDITETTIYLRFDAYSWSFAADRGLRLVARSAGREILSVPVADLSGHHNDLVPRLGGAIRSAAVDLAAALGPDAVARDVEVSLVAPESGLPERALANLPLVAVGDSSALLSELGVEGAVVDLADGRLRGWYAGPDHAVCLHIAGRLVAGRVVEPDESGRRRFSFRLGRLVHEGYGAGADAVSVRIAGTNVALPGPVVTAADALRVAPATAGANAADARPPEPLLSRVRRRLSLERRGVGQR